MYDLNLLIGQQIIIIDVGFGNGQILCGAPRFFGGRAKNPSYVDSKAAQRLGVGRPHKAGANNGYVKIVHELTSPEIETVDSEGYTA